jgi:hypothetical protein
MNGDFNDAYIDCALAHEIAPEAKAPAKELARLAAMSGMTERQREWEKQFGPVSKRPENAGEVVVLLQCGMAAHKDQIWFPIPIPVFNAESKSFTILNITIAFPRYVATDHRACGLEISAGGNTLCATESLTNLDTLALQNFYDQLPARLLRLAVRDALKATAAYTSQGKMGQLLNVDVASAFVSAMLALTEQADLRSWLLAPANLQCARFQLPEGEHALDLVLKDKDGGQMDRRNVKVKVTRGKFTILNIRAIDDFVGSPQISEPL